jgi:hypothetical protein
LALSQFLLPGEEVRHSPASAVVCGRTPYQVYVTGGRLLLHAIAGSFVKRERAVAENLADIDFMRYAERGLLAKRGVLTIHFRRNTLSLEGEPDAIKELWRQLQTQHAAAEVAAIVDDEQTLVAPPPPLFEDQPYPPAQVQPLSSAEPLPLEETRRPAPRVALVLGAVCLAALVAAVVLALALGRRREMPPPQAAALPASTPSPTPAPTPVVVPIMDEIFTLAEGSHRAVRFNVPAGHASARVAGGFRVTSGSFVDFYVMSREQYDRFAVGAPPDVTSVVYREEQWNARVGERLPAGDYYLVFDNQVSEVGAQSVAAQFSVVFDQSASAH